eukprot:380714_1
MSSTTNSKDGLLSVAVGIGTKTSHGLKQSDTSLAKSLRQHNQTKETSTSSKKKIVKLEIPNTSNKTIKFHPATTSNEPSSSKQSYTSKQMQAMNLLHELQSIEDDIVLSKHGFKRISVLGNTLQGCLLSALRIKGTTRCTIKKTIKDLHRQKICLQDEMSVVIDDNILKEAQILHTLTS